MAAMIGASTGAVFTSIVMIAEMTGDHSTILPVLLCVASANALRKWVCPPTIYSLKLNRRGHVVPEGLSAAISSARRLRDIMSPSVFALEEGRAPPEAPGVVVWSRAGAITAVERRFLSPARPEEPPVGGEAARYVTLPADCSLVEALRSLTEAGADVVLVSKQPMDKRSEDVIGVVTASELAGAMKTSARMM